MNMRGSYFICWMSLIFDALGVGHCGWATYYVFRSVFLNFTKADQEVEGMEGMHEKPEIMTIQSAELYHKTGHPEGRPTADAKPTAITKTDN